MEDIDKPVRVAQIIGKWVGGGVESVVLNYYKHIDRSKIQFDFICDEDSTNIPYELIEKMGGKIILIPPYQKLIQYHKKLKLILKEGNYKIVHSHINTLSVFSLFAAKKAKVPIRIAHSHSTTNRKEFKKNFMKQLLRPFSKLFATNYMACSELAGRWLFGNKVFNQGKVYILNNAIEIEKYLYDEKIRSKKRKELEISDDVLVIGHVGRFVEQKNHKFLIDIFHEYHKRNHNSLLLLIGQGPLEEEIKQTVNHLGLDDCVRFLGQRKDVNELYQAMDCFLLPSLYEGLPVVGIEAQANGLPCFFSDNMTKETKILDTTVIFHNYETAIHVSSEVLSAHLERNKNAKTKLVQYKFDISTEAEKLVKKYIELM